MVMTSLLAKATAFCMRPSSVHRNETAAGVSFRSGRLVEARPDERPRGGEPGLQLAPYPREVAAHARDPRTRIVERHHLERFVRSVDVEQRDLRRDVGVPARLRGAGAGGFARAA